MSQQIVLPPVYPITDKMLAGKESHLAIVKELVRGGASLIQVRDKSTPIRDLLADLYRCTEFCLKNRVALVVNDRCDLALCTGASGVHLGQDDLPPSAARSIVGPERIIGYSTNTAAQVRQSGRMPIQYIGFGPVFSTLTKENASPVVGIEGLRKICRSSPWPVVAIGGIGLCELQEVLAAGAASAAVISSLMKAPDLAKEMDRFLKTAEIRRN